MLYKVKFAATRRQYQTFIFTWVYSFDSEMIPFGWICVSLDIHINLSILTNILTNKLKTQQELTHRKFKRLEMQEKKEKKYMLFLCCTRKY